MSGRRGLRLAPDPPAPRLGQQQECAVATQKDLKPCPHGCTGKVDWKSPNVVMCTRCGTVGPNLTTFSYYHRRLSERQRKLGSLLLWNCRTGEEMINLARQLEDESFLKEAKVSGGTSVTTSSKPASAGGWAWMRCLRSDGRFVEDVEYQARPHSEKDKWGENQLFVKDDNNREHVVPAGMFAEV